MPQLTLLTSEFSPFRGGIGAVAREFAQAASMLGCDVEVLAPDYLGAANPAEDAVAPYAIRRYRAGPYGARWLPAYLRAALGAARDPGAGRLLAADGAFAEALALTRPLHGRQYDAIFHGSEVLRATETFKGRLTGPRRFLGGPRRIFANSAFTRGLLLSRAPYVDPGRVTVAPLGVGSQWFDPADPDALRVRLGLGDARIVACAGRICPRKGQLNLLRAMASCPSPEGLAVVIAGRVARQDHAYLAALRAEAAAASRVRVVFAEDLDDDAMRGLFAAAELFCLPGSARTRAVEGFGLVFLEAAAQGIPAVAGAVGGVPEAVLDGRTGVLVPPDDPHALGAGLADLLADAPQRKALGAAARAHARVFTWDRFARIVLERA
ncbi:MAG: phosphatidylinositol alpha-1,6-mannosyltransferase [Paracoccaceae bacterium]|jgi:phosphatidylinositol alpha-1,6-mannosyltransferase